MKKQMVFTVAISLFLLQSVVASEYTSGQLRVIGASAPTDIQERFDTPCQELEELFRAGRATSGITRRRDTEAKPPQKEENESLLRKAARGVLEGATAVIPAQYMLIGMHERHKFDDESFKALRGRVCAAASALASADFWNTKDGSWREAVAEYAGVVMGASSVHIAYCIGRARNSRQIQRRLAQDLKDIFPWVPLVAGTAVALVALHKTASGLIGEKSKK